MFIAVPGETLSRITPPLGGDVGMCQSGVVAALTETELLVDIRCPLIRRMRFDRQTGFDMAGQGTFLVRPDFAGLARS